MEDKSELSQKESDKVKIIRTKSVAPLNYNYLFKIALIGDAGIGKSSILMRFTENDFREDTTSTIGVDFKIISMKIGEECNAKMQIWDTGGSERFKSMTSYFIKSCPAFLLIFDLTRQKSFKNLDMWLNMINENTSPKVLCLIGNKSDLEESRQVSKAEAMEYAIKNNLKYLETSAKTNNNIENVFVYVASALYSDVKKINTSEKNNYTYEMGKSKTLNLNDSSTKQTDENIKKNSCCRQ